MSQPIAAGESQTQVVSCSAFAATSVVLYRPEGLGNGSRWCEVPSHASGSNGHRVLETVTSWIVFISSI